MNKQSGSLFIILLYFMQTCYSMNNNMFQPNNNSRSQHDVLSKQAQGGQRRENQEQENSKALEAPESTTTTKNTPSENKEAFGTINVEQYIDAEMNIRFSIKNTDENTLYYLPKILMYTNFNDSVKRDECELNFTDHSNIAVQYINDQVSAIVNISPETYSQLKNTINFTSENKRTKFSDEIIYNSNINIGKAVRASCSYPLIFSPCEYNETELVDGGVRENIPWKGLKEIGADKVISVAFDEEKDGKCCKNIIEVVSNSLDIMRHELYNYEINGTDYLLKIKTKNISLLDMEKIDELFEIGYKTTKLKIKEIKKIIR